MTDTTDFQTFIQSRPLGWWRAYYTHCVHSAQTVLKRELTCAERKQIKQEIRRRVCEGSLCSAGTLALLFTLDMF